MLLGQPQRERAESRSVAQRVKHEINEHTGAGGVSFQEKGKEECSPLGAVVGPEKLAHVGKECWIFIFSPCTLLGAHNKAGWGNNGRV